jgi:secondary thiamine-phosphate synthase enzyme
VHAESRTGELRAPDNEAPMRSKELSVDTSAAQVVDLTDDIQSFVDGRGDGLLCVLAMHATAGLALMETRSGSESDLVDALARILPRDDRYRHRHGSTGHGADHVLPAFISPSLTLPVAGGRLVLGTWQRVVLVDLNSDNPQRRVRLDLLTG